ncbi:MAG: type II toxin-antitoxin system HicA family toxin [Acidimicrobiales bacterium]
MARRDRRPPRASWRDGPVKVREVIRRLERDGWRLDRQVGGHRQYRHAVRPGTVTVPGNLGDDLAPGTLASIRRQAGWRTR